MALKDDFSWLNHYEATAFLIACEPLAFKLLKQGVDVELGENEQKMLQIFKNLDDAGWITSEDGLVVKDAKFDKNAIDILYHRLKLS